VRYEVQRPRAPLGDCVQHFWVLSDTPNHARERIVPSGTLELVINLHAGEFRVLAAGTERRLPGTIVSGCYSRSFEIDTRGHAHVLGVHFKPGGAARLLGVPPGELADAHVGLDDLWGGSANDLRERLCALPTDRLRVGLLEQALMTRLPGDLAWRPAVKAALIQLDQPGIEVGQVARSIGLSHRRFIQIFTEDVGMAPKRYAMVRRFQRALAIALQGPSASWARIAVDCGYFDQAHLCRDWQEIAGVSPAALLRLRGIPAKDNHVAIADEQVKSIQYASSVPRVE
jgi:AraC-like DNA-binding protein